MIGGGAAGLFCAIHAGKRGRQVLVVEHSDRIGKKIAISGGGRCNFTNLHTTPENFISENPHFCKSALARYTPADFISLVEKHGIAYHEKKLGQLFCDEGSEQIINLLVRECNDAGIEIRCRTNIKSVATLPQRAPQHQRFELQTDRTAFTARSLVVATGGLSIAPLGATDFGYRLARQFDLELVPPRPALVPFTLAPNVLRKLRTLSGISIDATVRCGGKEFRENILITHRGLSGPAMLQISSYWRPGQSLEINLLPDHNALEILETHKDREITLANLLSKFLPRRFALAWCNLNFSSLPLKQYRQVELVSIARNLNCWQITPAGTEGYRKAEVTAGGLSTKELSSQTMAVKRVPGLYFIGEVVDVTGHLGGFNFQWAWASGYAAGEALGMDES